MRPAPRKGRSLQHPRTARGAEAGLCSQLCERLLTALEVSGWRSLSRQLKSLKTLRRAVRRHTGTFHECCAGMKRRLQLVIYKMEVKRSHIEGHLCLYMMLCKSLWCCILLWHRWVFQRARGYDCLIIQSIMWGRPGPQVTAAPRVSKQLCRHEYANETERRHWLFTRQHSESVSSFLFVWFFSAGRIDDDGLGLGHVGWMMGRVLPTETQLKEISWEDWTPTNRISLGSNHFWLPDHYILSKAAVLRWVRCFSFFSLFFNGLHFWSWFQRLLFLWIHNTVWATWIDFFYVILCSCPSAHLYLQTKALPRGLCQFSIYWLSQHNRVSLLLLLLLLLHQLGSLKNKVFTVPAVDRAPRHKKTI